MSSFVVEGGHKLSGTIRPQGAKNEALQVISAVLLTKEEVRIENIPEILDVKNLILLLEGMGVKVTRHEKGVYTFKADEIDVDYIMSADFVAKCARFSPVSAAHISRSRAVTRSAVAGWIPISSDS